MTVRLFSESKFSNGCFVVGLCVRAASAPSFGGSSRGLARPACFSSSLVSSGWRADLERSCPGLGQRLLGTSDSSASDVAFSSGARWRRAAQRRGGALTRRVRAELLQRRVAIGYAPAAAVMRARRPRGFRALSGRVPSWISCAVKADRPGERDRSRRRELENSCTTAPQGLLRVHALPGVPNGTPTSGIPVADSHS